MESESVTLDMTKYLTLRAWWNIVRRELLARHFSEGKSDRGRSEELQSDKRGEDYGGVILFVLFSLITTVRINLSLAFIYFVCLLLNFSVLLREIFTYTM